MKLSITTNIDLNTPDDETAFVSWLDVAVARNPPTTKDDAPEPPGSSASPSGKIAIVHVGEITDAHSDLWSVLRANRIEVIHDAYFAQGWYRDEYADGAGIDLLFIKNLDVDPIQRSRNVDLAIVRRICDTLGSGCQLAVMPYFSAEEAAHWARLGFQVSTPGRSAGLMHMKLGYRHARVVDATGSGHFEIVPTTGCPTPVATNRLSQN